MFEKKGDGIKLCGYITKVSEDYHSVGELIAVTDEKHAVGSIVSRFNLKTGEGVVTDLLSPHIDKRWISVFYWFSESEVSLDRGKASGIDKLMGVCGVMFSPEQDEEGSVSNELFKIDQYDILRLLSKNEGKYLNMVIVIL